MNLQYKDRAYSQLIEILVDCGGDFDRINNILDNNRELVDEALVVRIRCLAQTFSPHGEEGQAAAYLWELAFYVEKNINFAKQRSSFDEKYLHFLTDLIQVVEGSQGDSQVVYPFLEANLDILDENLVAYIKPWAEFQLENRNREETWHIAKYIGWISLRIYNFPGGQKPINCEIALEANHISSSIFSPDLTPLEYAQIQCARGMICSNRSKGNFEENQEQAISAFKLSLEFFTKENHPTEWANIQYDIGVISLKIKNVEQSIKCCEQALEVFTRINSPQNWAKVQDQLGSAYAERSSGEKTRNLAKAIFYFNSALEVFTRKDYPKIWAEVQAHLGDAYNATVKLENPENFELALEAYNSALEIFTREASPVLWARIQYALGGIYSDRQKGDRGNNLEDAIKAYKAALEIFTPQVYPNEYVSTQCALGGAFRTRIKGDQADNIEKAIEAFYEVQKKATRLQSPDTWASIQNSIGLAYLDRIHGEEGDNIEKAVEAYKAGLEVTDRDASPKMWGVLQNNLGLAYSSRTKGDQPAKTETSGNKYWDKFTASNYDKKGNLEKAITAFEAALQVRTRHTEPYKWAMTQHNLGNAYAFLGTFQEFQIDSSDSLKKAIRAYKAALEVRTREAMPQYWAMTQLCLGRTYCKKAYINENVENIEKNLLEAIEALKAASKVYTRQGFPKDHAYTLGILGSVYLMQADNLKNNKNAKLMALQNAYQAFKNSIDTIEFLRDEIISGEESRLKFTENNHSEYAFMVVTCLKLGKATEALEYAEKSKNRNLVELILSQDLHSLFPDAAAIRLKQLGEEIFKAQYDLQNAQTDNVTLLEQHLQKLRQERNELQNRYLQIGSNFNFDQFRLTLNESTTVVEFYLTLNEVFVFIFTRHTVEPIVIASDLEEHKSSISNHKPDTLSDVMTKRQKIKALVNGYFKTYYEDKERWIKKLEGLLEELANVIDINEVLKQIPQTYTQLIFVPHQVLHIFPLHILPISSQNHEQTNQTLMDRFSGGIRYTPSCQILQLVQSRLPKRSNFSHLFAIQNPTSDLLFTDLEVSTIKNSNHFHSTNVFEGETAKKEVVQNNRYLPLAHCSHFSCHGYFDLESAYNSYLLLAENKPLMLPEIFGLPLKQCRLVVLSACETGLINFDNVSDEYIGLPSGFLFAGSPTVISSLWSVPDISTAFLMIKFYEELEEFPQLKEGEISIALKKAQTWLRNLTVDEFDFLLEQFKPQLDRIYAQLPKGKIPSVQENIKQIRQCTPHPFSNPYYWAAFTVIGV